MIQIFDCDQGSEDWFRHRMGIPTASNFSAILAKGEGKTRKAYLHRLAAEIITGEPGESFTTQAMERGKVMEDEARDLYAFTHDVSPQRVGFVKSKNCGASPDSLIGTTGGLEVKTQRADLLVSTILEGRFPAEHKAQVQGNLMVTGREWWDLVVYWPKMPLFVKRAYRDEDYIYNLSHEIDRFNEELGQLVEALRRVGKKELEAA